MDFFSLAKTPSVYSPTRTRLAGTEPEFGGWEPSIDEKQQADGSWVGHRDGSLYYDSADQPQPNEDPGVHFASPANINILSVPQIAALAPFDYVSAGRVRSYVENVSPINSVESLSSISGVSEADIDSMPHRDDLVLRPTQNVNRLVSSQGLETSTLTQAQEDELSTYINDHGYITDADELGSVIGENERDRLNREGIMAAPPANIHHLSSRDLEKIAPSGSDLYRKVTTIIDEESVVTDGFAGLSQELDGPDMMNMSQLQKMGVRFRGVASINQPESVKNTYDALTLDEIPGTNNSESELQDLIDGEGFLFDRGDVNTFLNEAGPKMALIFESVGLAVQPLEHFDDFTVELLSDITPMDSSVARKIIDDLNQSSPINNADDFPQSVESNSIIHALRGVAWPRKNINTLPESELESLPGISEDDAAKIVAYRRKQGDILNDDDFEMALTQP